MDASYLDLLKALDYVSHVKLMNKLSAYGLGNKARKWLRDFLNSRTQRVAMQRVVNGFILTKSQSTVEFRVLF